MNKGICKGNANRNRRRMLPGQALAEFALTSTAFTMLLFGIINFGRATYAYTFVAYASHNATRWASVRGAQSGRTASATDVSNYVNSMMAGMQGSNLTVNTSWSPDNQPGSSVQVQVTYNFPLSVPFMKATTLPLSATSKFVISE